MLWWLCFRELRTIGISRMKTLKQELRSMCAVNLKLITQMELLKSNKFIIERSMTLSQKFLNFSGRINGPIILVKFVNLFIRIHLLHKIISICLRLCLNKYSQKRKNLPNNNIKNWKSILLVITQICRNVLKNI